MATGKSRARYVPDHKSFQSLMLSQQIQDVVEQATDKVRAEAERTAPTDSGAYAKAFKTQTVVTVVGGNPRVAGEVYNDDPAAPGQEFGDRWGNPARRTLGRAAEAAGGEPLRNAKSWGAPS